jgi:hypothetical protein
MALTARICKTTAGTAKGSRRGNGVRRDRHGIRAPSTGDSICTCHFLVPSPYSQFVSVEMSPDYDAGRFYGRFGCLYPMNCVWLTSI